MNDHVVAQFINVSLVMSFIMLLIGLAFICSTTGLYAWVISYFYRKRIDKKRKDNIKIKKII